MKRDGWKRRYEVRGSMTVEMSFLMPMILFLIMGCVLAVFYYHDKNILAGAAYETVVVGSTKVREREEVKKGELESLFYQRAGNKCILFANPQVAIRTSKDEIEAKVNVSRRYMRLSVTKKAAVTEPERYIREIRRSEGKGR